MKHCTYLVALCCAALISAFCPFSADARDDASQAQMDSLAVRLAKRLEAGAWKFTATSFTGDNNIRVDYLDAKSNTVTMLNDKILIRLDFFGARITAMGTTPHQRGRAIAETAAAVRLNGVLPNNVKTIGVIEEKSSSVGRKSKSVTLSISYTIEDTNLETLSSSASANIYVDTADLTTRIVFNKMNLDGTLEGKITLL